VIEGRVKFFNVERGFGFITRDDGERDVFVHARAVERSGVGALSDGDLIQFEIQERAGRVEADNLRRIGES
jgi:CspA family cold shock protein